MLDPAVFFNRFNNKLFHKNPFIHIALLICLYSPNLVAPSFNPAHLLERKSGRVFKFKRKYD